MIGELLISPKYLVIVTIVIWIIIFQLLYRVLCISKTNWKRLEYLWLLAGFLGLVNLVVENRKEYSFNSSERVKNYINLSIRDIKESLSNDRNCFKYTKSKFSPDNFDEVQNEQDKYCELTKRYFVAYDTIQNVPRMHFKLLNDNNFKANEIITDINDLNELIKTLNSEIDEYNLFRNEYDSKNWSTFSKTFGVLLLIIALAIRLSIATYNVIETKKNEA